MRKIVTSPDADLSLDGGTLYSIVPLKDIVVFPNMIVPLFVGRKKSVKALEDVIKLDKKLLLLTQKSSELEEPGPQDLYSVGTVATILQILKLPDGTVKLLVEGHHRAQISKFVDDSPYLEAYAQDMHDPELPLSPELDALMRAVLEDFDDYVKVNKKIPPEIMSSIIKIDSPSRLADTIASHLTLKIEDKQFLLETFPLDERLERVYGFMEGELSVLNVERELKNRVKSQMEKSQRDYYLNEQLKAIQKELGTQDEIRDELHDIEVKIKEVHLSEEAREKALSELKKLKSMPPMSSEATIVRNYLDWILSVPWEVPTKTKKNLDFAQKILDDDHYGLEKVKERIIEFLAVQNRVGKIKGSILCLAGPPGVGKTSLAKSIAKATGRNFVRISLGGVRDEAEIRGHRRTYIGAMPGRIIQGMKKSKSSNPLFLLDEIDKLASDWRGDPSSALLEVLDPEQNNTFNDHYLDLDYDLSDVMFITTANSLKMPQPLLDRMEVIRLSGYTEQEKLEISKKHLIEKIFKNHGVRKGELVIEDDAIIDIIRHYTREAGVRNLEREISSITRKAIKEITMKKTKHILVSAKNLGDYLGVIKYLYGHAEKTDMVGSTTGLAWTEVGGELLTIEAVLIPGKGKMTITGKLGEVMQESVQAAASFVRSHAVSFGIEPPLFDHKDIHIHVPEGATPKDGPSAGVAMCVSIVSVMTGIAVRHDVAMTGEITLRGRVLPIGGLKEKLLAALRGGITTVIIPKENEKDLSEIPDIVKEGLKIIPVEHATEALKIALTKELEGIEWDENAYISEQNKKSSCQQHWDNATH
jgi:ATP-dependent Lon protease